MSHDSFHFSYGNDFFELVWENGQLGSSNRTTPKTPNNLCIGFSHQSNIGQGSSQIHDLQLQSPQSKSSCKKPIDEFRNLRPMKDCTYSSQQCLPYSAPLKKPRMDSSLTPLTNSQKQNFSNFLIPEVFLKSTNHHRNSATQTTRIALSPRVKEIEHSKVENSTSSKGATDNSTVIESAKGSHVLTGFQGQRFLTTNKWNTKSIVERSAAAPPPLDEHSEAVSHSNSSNGTTQYEALAKGKAKNDNLCNERAIASSSVCSIEASYNPNFGSRKHDQDSDDSAFLSDVSGNWKQTGYVLSFSCH